MKKLYYNDKVLINGRKGHVFTVAGYAKKHGYDIDMMLESARKNGHMLYCVNQEPSILCADPGYYESQKLKWKDAIELKDGEIVEIEGDFLQVKYMGNFSDMVHFKNI